MGIHPMGSATLKTLGIVLLLVGSARAAEISGVPTITDAYTVVIAGISIRFVGIDAPESDQISLDKAVST
jgi:endonuclease YncB( thermonuclease family)